MKSIFIYGDIPKKILYLESNQFFSDQIQCYLSIKQNLSDIEDIKEFDRICKRNPDLATFIGFYEKNNIKQLNYYRWVPLLTASVERSFSLYRGILSDLRYSLKPITVFNVFLLRNE